uniref:Uncharacterized protein LOC111137272 isoform X2 n=1 Tax=Crassostrea virginica TaxID=6565 RepID=A0A8B8EWM3_CRAVI|nr:uncharacterized protein LOC111137272 isoform X2 [Crassostrea virginica]
MLLNISDFESSSRMSALEFSLVQSCSREAETNAHGTAIYRQRASWGHYTDMEFSASPPGITDLLTQRTILEHLFLKRPTEGEFWYVIVAEWLEQLKRYIGLPSTRKFYHQRTNPGPIITRRDYAHTVDVVHEDAWRMMVQWYGLTDGHKPMKLVVYNYRRGPEIEHNQNSFKVMLSVSSLDDFHHVKFSKMEKIGHIEHKIRQLYCISKEQKSRLWAKTDTDSEWRLLLNRDKTVGKCLDIDSDFIRPTVALEVCDEEGKWSHAPQETVEIQECPTGPLCEHNIFTDLTSSWEVDIHEQIDHIGKSLVDNLHVNFNAFVQKAREFVDERDYHLRQRERDIYLREAFIEDLTEKLEEKEKVLDAQLESCERQLNECDKRKRDIEIECKKQREEIDRLDERRRSDFGALKASFENERDKFHSELQRMSEMYKIQDSRIKLDIGGLLFTTSLTTLNRDPDSMLAAMFSGRHELKKEDGNGSYFIDRDGTHFRYILNFLRDGEIKDGTIPENPNLWRELLTEAEYYQIQGLVGYLHSLLQNLPHRNESPVSDTTFV